jgi:hypothetical protein
MDSMQERFITTKKGSIASVQVIGVVNRRGEFPYRYHMGNKHAGENHHTKKGPITSVQRKSPDPDPQP